MDWIKRNLYFLAGSLLALVLMVLAGWYFYSKWQLNNENLGKLDEQYARLKRLYEQKPHPGSDKVDNVKAAREQEQELRAYIQKARQYFQNCPPIPQPESGKLTSQEFSSALSRTIDQMEREATKASVGLPSKDARGNSYSFSFAAQRESLAYAPGSLEPLSVQLGEVKAICSVLFEAKVNSLDALRRERVSDDDLKGPQTDYLPDKSVTNELAVMSPYEVVFHCFSSELAGVLAGFASSPCGLVVKTINVEPAPAAIPAAAAYDQPFAAAPMPAPVPAYTPPPRPAPSQAAEGPAVDTFAARYGMRAPAPRPAPVRPAYTPPVYTPQAAAPASRGGLPTALDEKQLKVTLMVYVVKLVPSKQAN
ncbi:MAG TPA: Amuc_1100 family pilus-like protein [Candidatus Paceibacterota bacterium]|nr:Amuc_1100 family pilus-like protein [Verrucomicrobiota bacterium]HSA11650.1 Amuc_1100 family pilus-like protein [Candidatus Paceibacterota bacterium]